MSERVNPYIAGAPVTDAAMFFGREDVFVWIEQNIAGRYANNTLVIHGQRRVGKTSVLKQLDRRLSDRYAPVFFDFQGRTHTTLDQFLWRLAREIIRGLRVRREVELPKPERAGTDSSAYISRDRGKSWRVINNGLLGAAVIYDVTVNPHDPSKVCAATPHGIFVLED